MKKILFLFMCLLLVGCGPLSNTPKKQVETLFSKYQMLDNQVVNDIDYTIFFNTDMSKTEKDKYTELLKRQYRDLTYTIKDETVNGDNATVEVEIEVYDYKDISNYRAINTLTNETLTNEDDTDDADGVLTVLIDRLMNADNRVKYTLNISLTKVNDTWIIDNLTTEQLSKINGIY